MDVMFCSLTVDMTDDEIKECIHKMHHRAVESEQGFLLTIAGYDKDPRCLWEVPEVVAFCQRLIDIGFLSVLAVYAESIPGLEGAGFGAMEVYMIASGRIKARAKYPITEEDFRHVMKLVEESNVKCAKILEEPCPDTGIKEHTKNFGHSNLYGLGAELKVPDGQQRHGNHWNKKKK
jgi:hypothetical protein